jgi:putative flippase GtrA
MGLVLLIPAYRPGEALPALVEAVRGEFDGVVVVDDGSGAGFASLFDACRTTVLTHASTRGKGAALKTGIAHILGAFPGLGIVTADADGQHLAEDVLRVGGQLAGSSEGSLVLGARQFGAGTPGRSLAGNLVARGFVWLLLGKKLTDTQTGLRGIPPRLLGALGRIPADGYEFELDMLNAAADLSVPIEEVPIATVYEPGNPTSHFRPFRDSLRIGLVLARFSLLSLATAALDNTVFVLGLQAGLAAAGAQVAARMASVVFHYPLARGVVFQSTRSHLATLPLYLGLVAVSGMASYQLLGVLREQFGWTILGAKLAAETGLFLVNFWIQRDLIFRDGRRG